MKIIPLSEGSFTIDKTKLFVPFDEQSHQLKDRPAGSLLVEIQPFVVITSRDILLLDTGLGFEKNGLYSFAMMFSSLIAIPSTGFTAVIGPKISYLVKKNIITTSFSLSLYFSLLFNIITKTLFFSLGSVIERNETKRLNTKKTYHRIYNF